MNWTQKQIDGVIEMCAGYFDAACMDCMALYTTQFDEHGDPVTPCPVCQAHNATWSIGFVLLENDSGELVIGMGAAGEWDHRAPGTRWRLPHSVAVLLDEFNRIPEQTDWEDY